MDALSPKSMYLTCLSRQWIKERGIICICIMIFVARLALQWMAMVHGVCLKEAHWTAV